jgi:hypothetical protein
VRWSSEGAIKIRSASTSVTLNATSPRLTSSHQQFGAVFSEPTLPVQMNETSERMRYRACAFQWYTECLMSEDDRGG